MGLFENRKANVMTELERDLRKLEEKGSPKTADENMQFFACNANIEFAQRAQLISQQQAQEMLRRLQEAKAVARERDLQKKEYADDMVDGFENPREKAVRYQTMESINAEIQQERAQEAVDKSNQQSTPVKQSPSVNHGEDTESRMR